MLTSSAGSVPRRPAPIHPRPRSRVSPADEARSPPCCAQPWNAASRLPAPADGLEGADAAALHRRIGGHLDRGGAGDVLPGDAAPARPDAAGDRDAVVARLGVVVEEVVE